MTDSGGANYAATKAAFVDYTHGWARDLGPKNITVNLVQPGPIIIHNVIALPFRERRVDEA